jgi:hypothetical protein
VCLNFIDILFQDQNVKGLSDFFCTAVYELGLDISNCGGVKDMVMGQIQR